MNNLYNKIYNAVNEGIQKALLIDPEQNDVSINYSYHKIDNKTNLLPFYVSDILKENNIKENYKEILRYSSKNNLKYKVADYKELKTLIILLCKNVRPDDLLDLNWINVTNVTDMSELFYYGTDANKKKINANDESLRILQSFNGNISDWDVSHVTNMRAMFCDCMSLNQDLSNWDVSNVIDMSHMFQDCQIFNAPLNKWGNKLKKVTTMAFMFNGCKEFNQPINNWNVSNVIDMHSMFYCCLHFNKPLNRWANKILQVKDMSHMFYQCADFKQDLSSWTIKFKNTNISEMLAYTKCININQIPNVIYEKSF